MDEQWKDRAVEVDSLERAEDATPPPAPSGETAPSPSRRTVVVRRVAYDAVFAALALTMFVIEMQIPLPLPIPGVKLGLSNIVSLFAMFALGPVDAAIILMVRIGLGSIFSGSLTAFLYSLAGGAVCYLVTLGLYCVLSPRQIWVAGVMGAVVHVSAQVVVAALLTRSTAVFYYLPVLVAVSIGTGAMTGLLAQFVYLRTCPFFAKYRSGCIPKALR